MRPHLSPSVLIPFLSFFIPFLSPTSQQVITYEDQKKIANFSVQLVPHLENKFLNFPYFFPYLNSEHMAL